MIEFYLKELKRHGIIPGNKNIENLERLYNEYVLPKVMKKAKAK